MYACPEVSYKIGLVHIRINVKYAKNLNANAN